MATKEATVTVNYKVRPDTGEDPSCSLAEPNGGLTLAAWTDRTVKEITVGPSDSNSIAVPSCCLLKVTSLNGKRFHFRALVSETEMVSTVVLFASDKATVECFPAQSIIINGNTEDTAEVLLEYIETA